MINDSKLTKKIRVSSSKTEKYPSVGCITVLTTKGESGKKILNLNSKAIELLGLSWADNGVTKIAVVRNYMNNPIVIGSTIEEAIKNTQLDGTYYTVSVNYKTHNAQSTKMAKILLDHFNLNQDDKEPVEFFLVDAVEDDVWTLSMTKPKELIADIELNDGEDVEIELVSTQNEKTSSFYIATNK